MFFCKEAYHHFPRPQITVHEMLRVCKKDIVFIEPNDHEDLGFWGRFIQRSKNSLKRMLGKTSYHPEHFKFEESGNYIYSLSKRELEKMALGINLRHISFKYLNDAYEKGVEFELAAANKKTELYEKDQAEN